MRLAGEADARRPTVADERGFTIIESALALGMIFTVCLALLSSLATGVRGIVAGRERSAATQIADEVLEQAKARTYNQVGHWLDDPTLAPDAAVTGTNPNYVFSGEPLAASTFTGTNEPFSPHLVTFTRDGVRYTRRVYVTRVSPLSGDPYKRVTATVSWDASPYAAAVIANSVSLTTLLFDAAPPPDPLLQGVVDADSGSLTITGVLAGVDLDRLQLWLPVAHGEIDSSFIRRSKGFAWTARTELKLHSGSATGCTTSNGGLGAECAGTKSETVADNDGGTAPPENDAVGPAFDFGGSVSAGSALSANLGGGESHATSTGRSCFSCYGPDIGDNDAFAYHSSGAVGPSSGSVPFAVGGVTGSFATGAATSCTANCAATELDVDRPSGNARLTSTAATAIPAIDLATISGAPSGYAGAVRIGATSVTATAAAGPGAAAPSTNVSSVNVQLYETTGTPGYRTVTIVPGTAASPAPAHAEFTMGIDTVILDTTVIARDRSSASTSAGGALTHAEVALTNWLTITLRFQVVRLGTPLADLNVELDYGRLAASSDYAPAP